jgi:hypothetical protein
VVERVIVHSADMPGHRRDREAPRKPHGRVAVLAIDSSQYEHERACKPGGSRGEREDGIEAEPG